MSTVYVIHTLAESAPQQGFDVVDLFRQIPAAQKISVLSGVILPGVAALLNRRPNFITGLTTVLLTLVVSLISEWITTPSTFDLGSALGAALPTLALAWGAQARLYKDTPLVKWLYGHGLVHGSDVDVTMLPPMQPGWDNVDNGEGAAPKGEPPAGYEDSEVDDDYDPTPPTTVPASDGREYDPKHDG